MASGSAVSANDVVLVVARALPFLATYLAQIINASITSKIFPDPWRGSLLVAFKKTATTSAPTDFRPIALLFYLSKVLEKIVHDQTQQYLVAKKILNPSQAGYRQHDSTETARTMTILLLFDFSKAFDTISTGRLLRVMSGMGFSKAVLCWISSYINGRRQKVISKSEGESDWLYTNLGVPQGSVLRPLLFSLCINDLQHILKVEGDNNRKDKGDKLQHFFYADALQIYLRVTIDQLESGVAALTSVVNRVYEWAGPPL